MVALVVTLKWGLEEATSEEEEAEAEAEEGEETCPIQSRRGSAHVAGISDHDLDRCRRMAKAWLFATSPPYAFATFRMR